MPMPPMSMAPPNESHSFQSYLEHKDDAVAPEWSYMQPAVVNVENGSLENNALAKATKDLMSLDPDRWRASRQPRPANPPIIYPGFAAHDVRSQLDVNSPVSYEAAYHHPSAARRRSEVFPFLSRQASSASGGSDYHDAPPTHFQPIGLMPEQYRTDTHLLPDPRDALQHHPSYSTTRTLSSSTSTSVSPPPTSASSTSSTLQSPNPHSDSRSTSSSREKSKRAREKDPIASTSTASSKRPRTTASAKGSLLSPSQKKANHIQSEQKRRANIRRGYEALCESVPALRAAIQEEEEALSETHGDSSSRSRSKKGKGGKSKLGDDSGKLDGRAGPRSENVVLAKTIDYLSSLVNEQTSLLQRLDHARSTLPSGHPLLEPPPQPPLWERQWSGGEGKVDDEDEDADDDPQSR